MRQDAARMPRPSPYQNSVVEFVVLPLLPRGEQLPVDTQRSVLKRPTYASYAIRRVSESDGLNSHDNPMESCPP